jgi:Mrp family chromosome partitioning ATPase
MQQMVQRIFFAPGCDAPRSVVFCGVDDENGSSSVCASAARMLAAKCSRSVCMVDINMRVPHLADIFAVDTTAPFADQSGPALAQCVRIAGNLWLATTDGLADDGGVQPSANEFRERMAQLCGLFDNVLIYAPGVGVCASTAHLSQIADAAILVIEANSTRRLAALNAKQMLDAAGVHLLGTVLHNRAFPIPKSIYKRL